FPFLLAGFFLSFLFPVPFFSFWPFETVIASCRHWPDLATDGIAGGTDVLFGVIFAGVAALGTSRVLYQSNQWLCFYSFLLLGIFLGWQLAAIVFVTSLAFHGIVLFVFQRSNLVLSLAAASFVVNVIVLYH
ncbi:MAG: hypothetical protein FWC50_03310, partial [Planctomycetaceae bacterium]|nr:hypothetical protein [Planctomycetaceae bacterium]